MESERVDRRGARMLSVRCDGAVSGLCWASCGMRCARALRVAAALLLLAPLASGFRLRDFGDVSRPAHAPNTLDHVQKVVRGQQSLNINKNNIVSNLQLDKIKLHHNEKSSNYDSDEVDRRSTRNKKITFTENKQDEKVKHSDVPHVQDYDEDDDDSDIEFLFKDEKLADVLKKAKEKISVINEEQKISKNSEKNKEKEKNKDQPKSIDIGSKPKPEIRKKINGKVQSISEKASNQTIKSDVEEVPKVLREEKNNMDKSKKSEGTKVDNKEEQYKIKDENVFDKKIIKKEQPKGNKTSTKTSQTSPKPESVQAKVIKSDSGKDKLKFLLSSSTEANKTEKKSIKSEPKSQNTEPSLIGGLSVLNILYYIVEIISSPFSSFNSDESNNDSSSTISTEEIASTFNNGTLGNAFENKESKPQLYNEINNLASSQYDDLYSFLPSFAPNYTKIHNAECRRQGQILTRQLHGFKLWALQMVDANAKIPSGLLRGNGNQLGDFDECVESRARVRLAAGSVVSVRGQYCLARLDVRARGRLQLPAHLAQARNLVRSNANDVGHFIPRFSSLMWAVCVPSACGAEDARDMLRAHWRRYGTAALGDDAFDVRVRVDPVDCTSRPRVDWSQPTALLALTFFGTLIAIVAYSTFLDFWNRLQVVSANESVKKGGGSEVESSVLSAFSLYSTLKVLTQPANADGDIVCIHGLRALCTLALLLAHKLIPLSMTPFTNRLYLTEVSNWPVSTVLRASVIYTDSFLLLSGTLTAYHMSQDLTSTGSIPWLRRYLARYIRLTPALLGVLVWSAWVHDKLGEGPQWGSLILANAELCKEHMWRNLLYIQNFFEFEKMCAPHTHQLALDMQLSLSAPAAVWLLHRRPLLALPLLAALHALSLYLRYTATLADNLSVLIYHGATLSQLYRTANLSYAVALHRATPYAAGLALGVALRQLGTRIELPKVVTVAGWAVALYFGAWPLLGGAAAAHRDFRYTPAAAASYAALASLAWALALSWIIFVCFTGNGGFVNRMLCATPLVFVSRISYAVYLTQFLVFFYNVATLRNAQQFTIFSLVDLNELAVIGMVSILTTVTLVTPMQALQRRVLSTRAVPSGGKSRSPAAAFPRRETDPPLAPSRLEDIAEAEAEAEERPRRALDEILEEEGDSVDDWEWTMHEQPVRRSFYKSL